MDVPFFTSKGSSCFALSMTVKAFCRELQGTDLKSTSSKPSACQTARYLNKTYLDDPVGMWLEFFLSQPVQKCSQSHASNTWPGLGGSWPSSTICSSLRICQRAWVLDFPLHHATDWSQMPRTACRLCGLLSACRKAYRALLNTKRLPPQRRSYMHLRQTSATIHGLSKGLAIQSNQINLTVTKT